MTTPPPFVNFFSNGPTWPSSVSYVEYDLTTLASSIVLQFPQVATTAYVTAGTINILTNNAAYTVTMPDVRIVSIGYTIWVRNSGPASLSVLDAAGGSIQVIPTGLTYALQIVDNSTAAGTWFPWQLGAGSSAASPAVLAGPGLIVNPLNALQLATNITSRTFTTGYTVLTTDRAVLLVWTGGSGTLNLPDIATLSAGFLCYVLNLGTGILTVATTVGGQTINGLATISPKSGDSFILVAGSGTAYYTIGDSFLANSNLYIFPDGSIPNPSIAFASDHTSGYSHAWTSANTQALNFSLNGTQQLSIATSGGVSTSYFANRVSAETYISNDGVYTFSSDLAKSRFDFETIGPNNRLNTLLYLASGALGVTSNFNTQGFFNITPADYQRDSTSYAAWIRVMS